MKKKILYIEDNPSDFKAIKKFLEGASYLVYPQNDTDWKSTMAMFVNYLTNANRESRDNIISYINRIQPNLVIIDVKLGGRDIAYGDRIHTDILMTENIFKKIPVIYLTSVKDKSELPLNTLTRYVSKNRTSDGYDITSTFVEVLNKINELLSNNSSPIQKKLDDNF